MFLIESLGDTQLVTIQHDSIDATNASEIKLFVNGVLEDMAGQKSLALDMSKVLFMDSSGLGALVSLLKSCGKETPLVLSGMNKKVADLFALTRMNRVFTIVDDIRKVT